MTNHSEKNTRVTLVYSYAPKNAGDMALTHGAIKLLLDMGFRVDCVSRYDENDKNYAESRDYLGREFPTGVTLLPGMFSLNRSRGLCANVKSHVKGIITLVFHYRASDFRRTVRKSDLLVLNGGNLLRGRSFTDWMRLLVLWYPLRCAKRVGCPTVIFPQSAGAARGPGRLLLRMVLKHADVVFSREYKSQKILERHAGRIGKIKRGVDCAFFIRHEGEKPGNSERSGQVVLVPRGSTLGDLGELADQERVRLLDFFQWYVSGLEASTPLVCVSQTEKDDEIAEQLTRRLNGEYRRVVEVIKVRDVRGLRNIYRTSSMVVSMRLHALIVGVGEGADGFGVFFQEWGVKNPGICEELGIKYQMLDDWSDGALDVDSTGSSVETAHVGLAERKREVREIVYKDVLQLIQDRSEL